MIYVNARALIVRDTAEGREIVIQTRDKHGENSTMELPGGRVEKFESLIAALRREVREETGLTVIEIEGMDTLVEVEHDGDLVECIRPFAVYQTLRGPVDSMGVYFRCQVKGDLLPQGDGSKNPMWVPVLHIKQWLDQGIKEFSWVDRAGLSFYLKSVEI